MNPTNLNVLNLVDEKLEDKKLKTNHSDHSTDKSRDRFLTEFGKATLQDRYLLPNESFQDMFMRVAQCYSDNDQHAQRIYDYISKLWFMPATPILSNGGAKGDCLFHVFKYCSRHSLDGILSTWENVWLASNGGGIGTYWGEVRSIGETVKKIRSNIGNNTICKSYGLIDFSNFSGIFEKRLCSLLSRYSSPRN